MLAIERRRDKVKTPLFPHLLVASSGVSKSHFPLLCRDTMVDKETSPPPEPFADTSSSPLTPNPKRARMSSPDKVVETPQETETTDDTERQQAETTGATPALEVTATPIEDEEVEAV